MPPEFDQSPPGPFVNHADALNDAIGALVVEATAEKPTGNQSKDGGFYIEVNGNVNTAAFGSNPQGTAGIVGNGAGGSLQEGKPKSTGPWIGPSSASGERDPNRSVFRVSRGDLDGRFEFDERLRTTTDVLWGLDRVWQLAVIADRADYDLAAELAACETKCLHEALRRLGLPQRRWLGLELDGFGRPPEGALYEAAALSEGAGPEDPVPAFVLRVKEAPSQPRALEELVNRLPHQSPIVVQVAGTSLMQSVNDARRILDSLSGLGLLGRNGVAVRADWAGIEAPEAVVPILKKLQKELVGLDRAEADHELRSLRAMSCDKWRGVLSALARHGTQVPDASAGVDAACAIALENDYDLDVWIDSLPAASRRNPALVGAIGHEGVGIFLLGLLRIGELGRDDDIVGWATNPHLRRVVGLYLEHADDWHDGVRLDKVGNVAMAAFAWRANLVNSRLLSYADFRRPLGWAGLHRTPLREDVALRLAELDPELRRFVRFVGAEELDDSDDLAELRSAAWPEPS